jgi:uncharacterized membrane-anchored protein
MGAGLSVVHLVTGTVPRRNREVATVFVVNQQYLTLIEQLVRDDRSEQEIDEIVTEVVREDARALDDELDELPSAA